MGHFMHQRQAEDPLIDSRNLQDIAKASSNPVQNASKPKTTQVTIKLSEQTQVDFLKNATTTGKSQHSRNNQIYLVDQAQDTSSKRQLDSDCDIENKPDMNSKKRNYIQVYKPITNIRSPHVLNKQ